MAPVKKPRVRWHSASDPRDFLLPKDDKLPVGYLSPSSVSMYLRCPKQFEFRYVDGLKSPPSVAMLEGVAHHHWLEHNNTEKMESGEDMKPQQAIEVFNEFWLDSQREDSSLRVFASRHEDEEVTSRAEPLITAYLKKVAPRITPKRAESQVDMYIAGVPVMMKVDLITADDEVLDYKVSSRKKSRSDVVNSLQLGLYTNAINADSSTTAGMVSLVHTKSEVSKETHIFTPGEKKWAGAVVSSVRDAIVKGAFPMTEPGSWACSERFCGYWHVCRGANSKEQVDDHIQRLRNAVRSKMNEETE